jgi:RNA polymerase sigma-70 factor (ECF subfamily)
MSEPDSSDAPATAAAGLSEPRPETTQDTEFAAFYRTTTKPLVAFLIMQGATLTDATDIVQDAMIKAYRAWHGIDHPRAWAYRVASRALIRRLVDRRDIPVEQPPEPSPPLLRSGDSDDWELRQDLIRALAALPHRQRQIMAWTLAEYTPTEIAAELQLTPGTVRQNLHLARRTLITMLFGKDGDQ